MQKITPAAPENNRANVGVKLFVIFSALKVVEEPIPSESQKQKLSNPKATEPLIGLRAYSIACSNVVTDSAELLVGRCAPVKQLIKEDFPVPGNPQTTQVDNIGEPSLLLNIFNEEFPNNEKKKSVFGELKS